MVKHRNRLYVDYQSMVTRTEYDATAWYCKLTGCYIDTGIVVEYWNIKKTN